MNDNPVLSRGGRVTRSRNWQLPFGVGMVWAIAAYLSLALREAGEGMLLLWLPSGIAVAALAATPRSRWRGILLAIVAAMLAVCTARGIPLVSAAGFAVAQGVE